MDNRWNLEAHFPSLYVQMQSKLEGAKDIRTYVCTAIYTYTYVHIRAYMHNVVQPNLSIYNDP